MTLVKMLVIFIHIGAGIIWIGALAYLRLILLPALGRAAPAVRGPMVMDVGPRTVRLVLRIAEVTIVAGIINLVLMGRVTRMEHFFTTLWGQAIFAGLLGSIVIYVLGQAVTRPTTLHLAETIRQVMSGQAPPDAPALLESLAARQRNALTVQLAIGVLVVLAMSVARFA